MRFLAVEFHVVYASVELPSVGLAERAVAVADTVVVVAAAAAAGVSEDVSAVAGEAAVVTLAAPGLAR